jgi:hypothetical protein
MDEIIESRLKPGALSPTQTRIHECQNKQKSDGNLCNLEASPFRKMFVFAKNRHCEMRLDFARPDKARQVQFPREIFLGSNRRLNRTAKARSARNCRRFPAKTVLCDDGTSSERKRPGFRPVSRVFSFVAAVIVSLDSTYRRRSPVR